MIKENKEVEERFYQECAELLCVSNTYRPFPTSAHYKRRWYNREAGNGRFEGFGLIRMFSENCIHVSLKKPFSINRIFNSPEDVITALRRVIEEQGLPQ